MDMPFSFSFSFVIRNVYDITSEISYPQTIVTTSYALNVLQDYLSVLVKRKSFLSVVDNSSPLLLVSYTGDTTFLSWIRYLQFKTIFRRRVFRWDNRPKCDFT